MLAHFGKGERKFTDMATKAQLINFIMDTFSEPDGNEVSKSKLEGFKKADLENFIKEKGAEAELQEWLKNA